MTSKFAALELETDKPGRMIIVHPVSRQPLRDAEGKEAYIDLYSADSEVARKHHRTVQRRRLAMRGRGKLTPEELDAENVELLAALTTGWYLLDLAGNVIDVPSNAENAREIYGNSKIAWLREQVDEYAVDRGNFSMASSAI